MAVADDTGRPLAAGLLDGSVMVVAGVGPGMGGHIGRLAAGAGAAVMLSARSSDYGRSLAEELQRQGRRAAFERCDITDSTTVSR